MLISTPHITADTNDIAKTVLMPGDPLRSKFIAETFIENPKLFNDVRGVQGYSGMYKGTPVSVMASGMGVPSIGIYSHELFNDFGVENIIRIGSAGAIADELSLHDIVIGLAASTDSNFAHQYGLMGTFAPSASYKLLREAVAVFEERSVSPKVGNILTSDNFYSDGTDGMDQWKKMGVLAVEMESAGLYMTAAHSGKNALCICTISDHVYRGESLPAQARQTSFLKMIEAALDLAVRI
jgi:purine-nucleoside phosphorylase, family 1 (deoD)